jgi:hypothetical protein
MPKELGSMTLYTDDGPQCLAGNHAPGAWGSQLTSGCASFLNIGYNLLSRRWMGWAIVGLAIVINGGLFIGSLIFLASGRSFEEFGGGG